MSDEKPGREMRHAGTYRLSTYISDERHVYTGPKHRRRAEALKDLAQIDDDVHRLRTNLYATRQRIEELEALTHRLRTEAEVHAMEARGANASLSECYQAATGATGEPGTWNGAEPVKQRIAEMETRDAAREAALQTALKRIEELEAENAKYRPYRGIIDALERAEESSDE